ncbi:uncharacterized protein [Parasteatoda tepidariorum]|uniref:uncharacterized protein n=1 Tax=Parasteatoda tepidariorum TaxID=114398 RepID=UPI0039BCD881
MHTDGAKTNLYPSTEDLLLCPYCSMNFFPKRIDNHKKYCKSALVECPICQYIYHIDEKEEHGKTCDALGTVLLPESDLKCTTFICCSAFTFFMWNCRISLELYIQMKI